MRPDVTAPPGRLGRLLAVLRERAELIGFAAFTFTVFLVALVWSLPHDLIAARAIEVATANAPVRVAFRSVELAIPNGYRFTDLRVTPTGASQPVATLSEVSVRVPLGALLTGNFRQAVVDGRTYGGDFHGWVRLAGDRASGALDARSIRLDPALAPLVPPPGRVQGTADLSLQLAGDGRTTQSSEGDVTLAVRDLALDQVSVRGFRLPDLSFPEVGAAAQVFDARLQLKELRAAGDDLRFEASGDVLLRDQLPQSVLNLRMTVEVPPDAPPALKLVSGLLPKRDPGEPPTYTVKGTIAAPVVR
ncbi:MAG: type II secretion system protein GspN [Deltaproteobacteria bacterium]|nr:type II secretion system protein GspN [Deltaproteobacteria bacterium]